MYNRILKRPMFKRGGSSYQSQGTGITSPYDTPRKNYDAGAWGEWEDKTRKLTQDPRGDFSYAAQGFSSLGNPYKESGEAKTIGEMLWEGANITRGSREKASELERKGELAILESQGGRMLSEEERAFKAEENRKERESKEKIAKDKGTYPDMHPGKLYDNKIKGWKVWVKNNEGRTGHGVVSTNIESFADADMVIRDEKIKAYTAGKKSLAQAVPPSAFKDDGTIDISILIGGVVYYDPMDKQWFTISNPGTDSAEPIIAESYIDGWNNIDPSTSPDSSQKSATDLSETDETIKTKKKVAKKYTQDDYEQSAKDTTEKIKERFTLEGDITQGVNPYDPKEDTAISELDKLQGWWNSEMNSKQWNKEIKDEG